MSNGLPNILDRSDVLRHYSADDRGLIDCPGIFYGRPVWLPYFWHLACDGIGDQIQELRHDGNIITETTIKIEDEERLDFPEVGDAKSVVVWAECGYVYGRTDGNITKEILEQALKTKSFINVPDYYKEIDDGFMPIWAAP